MQTKISLQNIINGLNLFLVWCNLTQLYGLIQDRVKLMYLWWMLVQLDAPLSSTIWQICTSHYILSKSNPPWNKAKFVTEIGANCKCWSKIPSFQIYRLYLIYRCQMIMSPSVTQIRTNECATQTSFGFGCSRRLSECQFNCGRRD